MCNCKKGAGSGSSRKPYIAPPSATPTDQNKRRRVIAPVKARTQARMSAPDDEVSMQSLDGETLAEKCQTFAYVLGIEEPVSERVLLAAVENPAYARRLLTHRDSEYLFDLLNNPPEDVNRAAPDAPAFSNAALVAKAGKALLNWGLSGFPTVSGEVIKRREDACLACPNLKASVNMLQKITASTQASEEIGKRTGNKSCSVCGCVITNKIRLKTETCPVASEENPDLNRWGEVIA